MFISVNREGITSLSHNHWLDKEVLSICDAQLTRSSQSPWPGAALAVILCTLKRFTPVQDIVPAQCALPCTAATGDLILNGN